MVFFPLQNPAFFTHEDFGQCFLKKTSEISYNSNENVIFIKKLSSNFFPYDVPKDLKFWRLSTSAVLQVVWGGGTSRQWLAISLL